MSEFDLNHIGISASKNFDSDETAIDKMSELRKMETPDYFVEQTVNLEADNREDTLLVFSDRESDQLAVGLGEDDGIVSFHFSFTSENIEPSKQLLERIVEILEGIDVDDFHLALKYHAEFEDFDLELTSSKMEDMDFIGVRLGSDDANYIIQEDDGEDMVSVMARHKIGSLATPLDGDFIDAQIETSKNFLIGLHNE